MNRLCFTLALLAVVALTCAKKKKSTIYDCPTDLFCQAISPEDKPNTFARCKNAEEGNEESLKICGIAHISNTSENPMLPVENPNEKRCEVSNTKKAKRFCADYSRTHSPFTGYVNGKSYTHCGKAMTPYYCTVGGKTYVACAFAAVDCPNPCEDKSSSDSSPNAGGT